MLRLRCAIYNGTYPLVLHQTGNAPPFGDCMLQFGSTASIVTNSVNTYPGNEFDLIVEPIWHTQKGSRNRLKIAHSNIGKNVPSPHCLAHSSRALIDQGEGPRLEKPANLCQLETGSARNSISNGEDR